MVCGVYPTKGINWERLKTLDNKNVKPQNLMNYNVNFIDPSTKAWIRATAVFWVLKSSPPRLNVAVALFDLIVTPLYT